MYGLVRLMHYSLGNHGLTFHSQLLIGKISFLFLVISVLIINIHVF